MNYIKEINAFYQRQETNPLSSHAANLWHTLMHINNRAGWKKTFTVAVSVIRYKSGLSDSTFKRARTELHEKGYIRYESRRGNQAAIYEMISLGHLDENNEEVHTEQSTILQSKQGQNLDQNNKLQSKTFNQLSDNIRTQSKQVEHLDDNVSPLLKQKETKKDPSTAAAEAVHFFNENFSKVKPYMMNEMIKWTNKLGESLVVAAMKRALDRGRESWGYVKAILQDWQMKGFQTIEEAETEAITFSKQAKSSQKNGHEEIIPDWFHDRDTTPEKVKIETAEEAKERMEMDRLLATFK